MTVNFIHFRKELRTKYAKSEGITVIKQTILLVQVVEAAADFVEVGHGHVGDVGHVPGDEGVGVQLMVIGVQEVQLARARQLAAEVGDVGVRH
jgi:hypothetical protein